MKKGKQLMRSSYSHKSRNCWILSAVLIAAVLAGCTAGITVMQKRSAKAPPIVYCHDGVGHIKGVAPWILGGKCCCTPTESRFQSYKEEETVPESMTYDEFLQLFADKGIITDLDAEYRGCNCRGELGPHVVFGGKCMVTPTPGTLTFEEVTSGRKIASASR